MSGTTMGRAVGIPNTSIVIKCNGVEKHFSGEQIASMVLPKILQAIFQFNDSQGRATIDVGTSRAAPAYDPDRTAVCVNGANTFILDLDRADFDNIMVEYLADVFFERGDVRSRLISRNTTIPVKKKVKKKIEYRTSIDNQYAVSIKVFEGDSDNNLLGSFMLSGFPSAPRGHLFKVCFATDKKGLLTVSAEDTTTRNGNKNNIAITEEEGMLSPKEIKRMIQEGRRFQVEDEKFRKKSEAKNKLENYVSKVREFLTATQSLLHGNKDARSKRCLKQMEKITSAIGEAQNLLHYHNQQHEAEAFVDCLKKLKTSESNMSDRSKSHLTKMERKCPSHKQPLQYIARGAPHICSGCRELGFGPSYRCKECNYMLHDECADPVSNTDPFSQSSKFEFYETAPERTTYCQACGKDVLGFVYHCSETGIYLHPCCLKLKGSISDEQGRKKFELSQKFPAKCAKCDHLNVCNNTNVKYGLKGWSYVSSDCNKCCYHVSCLKEWDLENWKSSGKYQFNWDG